MEPTAVEGLPIDILHYLIEQTLPSFLSPIPRTRLLLSLCLVSHSFLSIAQPVLYRSPFLSFDPPDTTPPGRTYYRIAQLLKTLTKRPDLTRRVKRLESLGRWSTRCLSEGVPNRKEVSKVMLELVRTVIARGGTNLRVLSFPFVTASDKGEFLAILSSHRQEEDDHEETDDWREGGDRIEEILFGEGGAFEPSMDPWVINLDQQVREEWGVARFTINDFRRLYNHEGGTLRGVKKFRLMARLRVEDPLEDDDELIDEEGGRQDEEKFEFRLEQFELNLLRNSKLSFNYLDRLLRSSRDTLTTLILKEHQFRSPSTLYRFLEAYGMNLRVLRTASSNQYDDNRPLLETIVRSCQNLRSLTIGSPTRNALGDALELLSSSEGELWRKLEFLELSNCYSLTFFPCTSSFGAEEEGRQSERVQELSRILFHFDSLKTLIIGPQHRTIEDGYEQERSVGKYFRDLDGVREIGRRRKAREIKSCVSFWEWKVEVGDG
ncbi:uncharacterized protein JCM6883_006050 [Sporobolomyces salmoneus]|uniref:uncharacterized protein n=1 Tax=Sporobolomyces salmoneus TaxID=183962 RepID=UPI00317256CA